MGVEVGLVEGPDEGPAEGFAVGSAVGPLVGEPDGLAEGRHSVAVLAARGTALGVELPITSGVDRVVNHGADLRQVVASLLARRAGVE